MFLCAFMRNKGDISKKRGWTGRKKKNVTHENKDQYLKHEKDISLWDPYAAGDCRQMINKILELTPIKR